MPGAFVVMYIYYKVNITAILILLIGIDHT